MLKAVRRLRRNAGRATTVLTAVVLLVPSVLAGPFVYRAAEGGATYGCTEQRCPCGDDCHCPRCKKHHGGDSTAGASSSGGASSRLALRSCGGMSHGPPGVFTISKVLPAPAGRVTVVASPLPPVHDLWREAWAPQRARDELFRPPRRRIG